MLIRFGSLIINSFCLISLLYVEELWKMEFFLINFHCAMEVIGSFGSLISLLVNAADNFHHWNCELQHPDYSLSVDYYASVACKICFFFTFFLILGVLNVVMKSFLLSTNKKMTEITLKGTKLAN